MLTLDKSTSKLYKHWTDVPASIWLWPSFKPQEIASKGDGSILIDIYSMNCLQKLRDRIGRPMIILSAYRDPIHNARIGGAPLSMHKKGKAFDVAIYNQDKELLYRAAKDCGFTGIGTYSSFLHFDTGKPREWHG